MKKTFLIKEIYAFASSIIIYLIVLFADILLMDIYDISGLFSLSIIVLIVNTLMSVYLIFLKKLKIYHFIIPDIILWLAIKFTANKEIDFDNDILETAVGGEAIAVVIVFVVLCLQIILQLLFIIAKFFMKKLKVKKCRR